MTIDLLPDDFDERAAQAVRTFWITRGGAENKSQGGSRGSVISGKNMDGFIALTEHVARHCGLPDSAVHTSRTTLPGYFRPTKNWDVLIIHRRRLLAAFEFKSQVGAFGNNFNNRSEEVIGAGADLWVANRQGAYKPPQQGAVLTARDGPPLINPAIQNDPRPPFLAWLMLLEDCEKSRAPVKVSEPHYRVFPEFRGASYAKRYHLLCERLMSRQLYARAALMISEKETGADSGAHEALSEATSLKALYLEFSGRLLAAMADSR